jgi:hypothetical protein
MFDKELSSIFSILSQLPVQSVQSVAAIERDLDKHSRLILIKSSIARAIYLTGENVTDFRYLLNPSSMWHIIDTAEKLRPLNSLSNCEPQGRESRALQTYFQGLLMLDEAQPITNLHAIVFKRETGLSVWLANQKLEVSLIAFDSVKTILFATLARDARAPHSLVPNVPLHMIRAGERLAMVHQCSKCSDFNPAYVCLPCRQHYLCERCMNSSAIPPAADLEDAGYADEDAPNPTPPLDRRCPGGCGNDVHSLIRVL